MYGEWIEVLQKKWQLYYYGNNLALNEEQSRTRSEKPKLVFTLYPRPMFSEGVSTKQTPLAQVTQQVTFLSAAIRKVVPNLVQEDSKNSIVGKPSFVLRMSAAIGAYQLFVSNLPIVDFKATDVAFFTSEEKCALRLMEMIPGAMQNNDSQFRNHHITYLDGLSPQMIFSFSNQAYAELFITELSRFLDEIKATQDQFKAIDNTKLTIDLTPELVHTVTEDPKWADKMNALHLKLSSGLSVAKYALGALMSLPQLPESTGTSRLGDRLYPIDFQVFGQSGASPKQITGTIPQPPDSHPSQANGPALAGSSLFSPSSSGKRKRGHDEKESSSVVVENKKPEEHKEQKSECVLQ